MWYDCSDDLKAAYLAHNSLPGMVVAQGKRVEKLHPITEHIMQVYPSVAHVIKEYKFSRVSFYNVIDNTLIQEISATPFSRHQGTR